MRNQIVAKLAGGALAAAFLAVPAIAQAPELAMLKALERGSWTVSLRGEAGSQRICVRDGREFIQLRHRQPGCDRFVVQDDANEVTVQYTCRGNGYGRTTIRREGRGLVQLRSQGIRGGVPFSVSGEARRTGSC